MAFSFGFAGDDIDIEEPELDQQDRGQGNAIPVAAAEDVALPKLVEARRHEMGEWLPTLPSQISYNKLHLTDVNVNASSEEPTGEIGKTVETGRGGLTVARREVFDIRTQLMAEDDDQDPDSKEQTNDELISGLEQGDIKPNFYEGGFKTWECALDLARCVVGSSYRGHGDGEWRFIELGAGTAIPSLALFAELLSQSGPSARKTHFTFADYNAVVLRLVTLPNLLLTWNYVVNLRQKQLGQVQSQDKHEGGEEEKEEEEEEELDITPELLDAFQQDLANRGITVDFISGAWSPAFVDLAFPSGTDGRYNQTLILASETIYSPSSLGAFSETLLALMRRSAATQESKPRALVAAKKVYFGVGGGVDEFLAVLRDIGSQEVEVKQTVDIKSEGVGRVVLDIVPVEKR